MELIEISHPLKDHYLTNLRDKNTDFDTFRDSASKLSYFLVVEATKHLTTLSKEIDTPLTKTKGVQIENNSVAISVLRAGLGLMDGVQQLIPNISFGFEKTTNFDLKKLLEIQKSGKTIVINSWNEYCSTCAAQTKVFDQAMKDFKDVEFLFYEQTEHEDIAKALGVNYWTTIVVFKGESEVAREIGLTDKDQIYNLINKGI